MGSPILRFPLTRHYITEANRYAYRFKMMLEIETGKGGFAPLPFRLDTGSDFMTIPQGMARTNGILFSAEVGLYPRTAAGPAHRPSFISRVSFSFPQLTAWKFETNCVFSPYDLPYCLLSLNDFVPHFVIRSNKETPDYPEGSVVFQLRTDHGGKRR